MSAPARALDEARRAAPAPDPAQPVRARPRRTSTSAFWVLTSVLVTAMVVGVVSLSALVVGSSLRADALQTRIATLSDQQGELRRDVATLSAPSRVMTWARSRGMVMADNVVILRVAAGSAPQGPDA